jgi:hypothetical protein
MKILNILNAVLITLLWVWMTINSYRLHTTKLRVAELDSILDRTQRSDQEMINSILHLQTDSKDSMDKIKAITEYLLAEDN